jgi:2-polyprenyl-3-methyl-5-hydroxy-6-metoxy-1,4-benzoquinol methylase
MAGGAPAQPTGKRHRSGWDTHKEERAVSEGMPESICRHVMNRALLIKQWIEPQDRVLDVGCGEGIITAVLAEQARSIIGCDYSSEAVRIAAERHPDIEFVCCNSTNLPFGAGSFDKVTMSDVAEHLLPVQFTKTLKEIHRVLLPGGMLILATPLTGKGANGANYAHIYEYSESEIERTLDKLFCDVRLVDKEFGLIVGRQWRMSDDMAATDLQKGACRSYGGESAS